MQDAWSTGYFSGDEDENAKFFQELDLKNFWQEIQMTDYPLTDWCDHM